MERKTFAKQRQQMRVVGEVGPATSNNFSAVVWPAGAKATFEHKRQFAELSSDARLDPLLSEALSNAKLAYQFAPGSYSFHAMRAVALAAEARREADWISEFAAWNDCGTGDVFADPAVEKPHPALAD